MDLARDRNGKTEEEFLREYDVTKYFRPSVTVDVLLFKPKKDGGKLLLIKRGGHPFIGHWAFPGGFVDANEPCETAAARELVEETGVTDVKLAQLITASTPGRDPRWRNITVVFCGRVEEELAAAGDDDAADAKWFAFTYRNENDTVTLDFRGEEKFACVLEVKRDAFGRIDLNGTEIKQRGGMAFDHAKIVAYLFEAQRRGEI